MRKLLIAALTLAALFLLSGAVWADSTTVTSMETACRVETDGSCQVVLHAQVNFETDTQDFEIPISPQAEEITVSGAKYLLRRTGEFTWISLQGSYSGPVDLTVSYRLAETVTDLGDSQTFAVTLLYPAWPCAIEGYSFSLELPAPFEGLPTILSGYYGDLIDNYMEVSIQEGTVHATLNAKQILQDHEAMSVSLSLPRDYFDLRFLAGKTVGTDRLLFFAFLILAAGYWLVFLRNLPVLPKRQTMPPVGGNAGEIPYVLTARKPDLALMVVQWASLGYLTIRRSRGGKISLVRQIDMGNERREFENRVFNTLFARRDVCDLRSAEYARAKELSRSAAREYWQDLVYNRRRPPALLRLLAVAAGLALCLACLDQMIPAKSWRWFAVIPGTLAGGLACRLTQDLGGSLLRRHTVRSLALGLGSTAVLLVLGVRGGQQGPMLLCLLLQLAVGFLLRCGGPRTTVGSGLAAELLGYRRYLLSASGQTLRAHLNADPQYFYRTLPFADALRVARIFTAGLSGIQLEACDWLEWEGKPSRTAQGFYTRYCMLMCRLRGEREPLRIRRRRAAARARRRRR